ncbi:hypothetical protein OAO01_02665, partial [Oligoflexia bacterium]|nr:hypothetical protein [Oligoflexia bacterium]
LKGRRSDLICLFILPLFYVVFYGATAWHGGQSLNMRYFIPLLPFWSLAIACIFTELPMPSKVTSLRCAIFIVLLLLTFLFAYTSGVQANKWLLLRFIPCCLAFMLLALCLLYQNTENRLTGLSVSFLLVVCLSFAFVSTLIHDFRLSYHTRKSTFQAAQEIEPYLQPGSLLAFSTWESAIGIISYKPVYLYRPAQNSFKGFTEIINPVLCQKRPAYLFMYEADLSALTQRQLLAAYRIKKHTKISDLTLYELSFISNDTAC